MEDDTEFDVNEWAIIADTLNALEGAHTLASFRVRQKVQKILSRLKENNALTSPLDHHLEVITCFHPQSWLARD